MVPRLLQSALAAVAALTLALVTVQPTLAAPLLATQSSNSGDRLMVIAWTLAAITGALLLTALGYVFRRALGSDRTPPVTILEPGHPTGRTD